MRTYPTAVRIVLQRVSEASVTVDGVTVGAIDRGYLLLVGVGPDDTAATAVRAAERVVGMRLFPNPDEPGRKPIDVDLATVGGAVLAVSQFTLYADVSRGRRPSFTGAAPPAHAEAVYDAFVTALRELGVHTETGRFGAHMDVALVNDGPVTIVLDQEEPRT